MFNSQYKQDKILEEKIFRGFKNGFFVDVGAHDGITINNTLYFEEYNMWKGLNIEANPDVFEKLKKNRPNCININCAACNKEGETDFIKNSGYTEMISGIKDTFDIRHIKRLERENLQHGSKSLITKVTCKKLEDIFDDNKIRHINYLTVDVEGAEFEVIKSINFEKVFIDVIEFENNYDDVSAPIILFLENLGYKQFYKNKDIFMINIKSSFLNALKDNFDI